MGNNNRIYEDLEIEADAIETNSDWVQCKKIVAYMKIYGSITPKEAEDLFSCMRLASRINELRRRGYKIKTNLEAGFNKQGKKTRYARYSFVEEK